MGIKLYMQTKRRIWNPLNQSYGTCALWLSTLDKTSMYVDTTETIPSTNGANVGRWKDKSGNNRHCDNDGIFAMPTLDTASGINGYPALRFTIARLISPAFNIPIPCSIYIVAFNDTGGSCYFADGRTQNTRAIMSNGGGTDFSIYSGAFLGNQAASWPTAGVMCGVFNGASSINRFNATETTGDPGSAVENGGFCIGDAGLGTGSSPGEIGEVLIYLAAHNLAQRKEITISLKQRWNTP